MTLKKMKIELNQEQINILSSIIISERAKMNQNKEIGKRLFRKYGKIYFSLTGNSPKDKNLYSDK